MRASVGLGLALLIAAPCWTQPARAQKATEQFIPLGRSPGLSGTYTHIGKIAAVDLRSRSLTVVGARGARRQVDVPESARIWLDRSPLGLGNVSGSLADCQVGRTVEVTFEDPELRRAAAWIKVRIESPPTPAERILRGTGRRRSQSGSGSGTRSIGRR